MIVFPWQHVVVVARQQGAWSVDHVVEGVVQPSGGLKLRKQKINGHLIWKFLCDFHLENFPFLSNSPGLEFVSA